MMGMGSDVTEAAKVSMMVFAFSLLCKLVDVAGGTDRTVPNTDHRYRVDCRLDRRGAVNTGRLQCTMCRRTRSCGPMCRPMPCGAGRSPSASTGLSSVL